VQEHQSCKGYECEGLTCYERTVRGSNWDLPTFMGFSSLSEVLIPHNLTIKSSNDYAALSF